MPILKSAKKRIRSSERRRAENDSRRRAMRDTVKELKKLIVAKDAKAANELLPKVYKTIDKAAKAGVVKFNSASRKKSRLNKSIKNIEK